MKQSEQLHELQLHGMTQELCDEIDRVFSSHNALEKQADYFREQIRELRELCNQYRKDKNKWHDIAMGRTNL